VSRAAVIGSGSWGTAFGMVLADAGTHATILARRAEVVASINDRHENPEYLPGVVLPPGLRAETSPVRALDGADFVVLALPCQTLRANLETLGPLLPPDAVVVSLMKGIEVGSGKRMTEVVCEVAGTPADRAAVISGPNLACEIVQRQPAASVVACAAEEVAVQLQAACQSGYFRPYTNTDVIGCELGGAVKNVIALAVGIAVGMGYGDNARASLITRGLAETTRLGVALGADPLTFSGLAGLGDLVATCSSPLSRNRRFGENLGRGLTVEQVREMTRQTAEGVESCASVLTLARRHGVDVPITEHVAALVRGELTLAEMVRSLLAREAKREHPLE
jgi:glycerol-3-phosphate dehydrogenase (NAD(P)+)